jgi:hypothetical protein
MGNIYTGNKQEDEKIAVSLFWLASLYALPGLAILVWKGFKFFFKFILFVAFIVAFTYFCF